MKFYNVVENEDDFDFNVSINKEETAFLVEYAVSNLITEGYLRVIEGEEQQIIHNQKQSMQ